MNRNLVTLSNVQRREVDWLRRGTIPRGMLSIVAGHPGLGKSLWTLSLAADLTHAGMNVVVCSAEDSLEHSIKPRLQAAAADTSKIHALIPRTEDGDPRGVGFPSDAPLLLEAILAVDAALCIIDPVTAHIDTKVDSHNDASLRGALAPLARIAEETHAALLAVYHLNKTTSSSDPMMRVGGSIGGPGAARSALLIDRDPDDPDKDRGQRRVLAHFKCNIGPLQPSRLLEVVPVHLEAADGEPPVDTAAIVDVGESKYSAGGILSSNSEDRTALDEACDFLREELDGGVTVAAKTILKRSRELGISDRTLKRAKTVVGVEAVRSGFGSDGAWSWRIATETAPKGANGSEPLGPLSARARAGGLGYLAPYAVSNTTNPTNQADLSKEAKEDCDLAPYEAKNGSSPHRGPSEQTPLRARTHEAPDDDIPW